MNPARIALIVARARNGCIGRDNRLPWHLPGDLRYFRQQTLGKPVVMGRRTWESLRGPLPGRTNIVVSRQQDYVAEGARCVSSLDEALVLAGHVALIDGADEIMVMGGADLYRQALPRAVRLYVTEVHAEVPGDAFFPPLEPGVWQELSREDRAASDDNPFDYSFVVYERAR